MLISPIAEVRRPRRPVETVHAPRHVTLLMPWLITDRLVGLVTPLFLALHQLRVWKSLSANENLQMGSHVLPGAGGLLKGVEGNGS